MTPSAVHYYFPGREALLDALIVDGWDSLAMALRARYEQTRPLPAHERWIAVTRAHRAWALEHPSEYLLLYGHTGLRVTPGGDRGVHKAMSKVVAVLFTMMRDALAAGEIDTERLQAATPPPLRQQLADWRETTEEMAGLPDGALVACLIGYAQLHGAITLELIGRIPPQLHLGFPERAATSVDAQRRRQDGTRKLTFLRLGTPSSRRVAEGPPVVARCEAASRHELLTEHGGAAVADPFGDLLDGQARGF